MHHGHDPRRNSAASAARFLLALASASFVAAVVLGHAGSARAASDPTKDPDNIFAAARSAVAKGQVQKTTLLGGNLDQNLFNDQPGDGAVLMGFEVGLGPFLNDETVYAIRPIYLTPNGESASEPYGLFYDKRLPNKKVVKTRITRKVRVLAKPGYAVGGVTLRTGLNIDGMSVTFMRISGRTLDPNQSYVSEWLGGRTGGTQKSVTGDGAPVVGVFGNQDADHIYSLGLVLADLPPAPIAVKKPEQAPVAKPAPPEAPAKPEEARDQLLAPKQEDARNQPAVPEAEDPDQSVDSSHRPTKEQPAASGGISWIPIGVFGFVTAALFGTFFLVIKLKGQAPSVAPNELLQARERRSPADELKWSERDDQGALRTSIPPRRRPEYSLDYPTAMPHDLQAQGFNGMATASLTMGCIGLLAWCLPILGLPLSITGLTMGVKGLRSQRQGAAIAGIVLNLICLGLSILNAALGVLLALSRQGVHGR